jgi:hypothetical protein
VISNAGFRVKEMPEDIKAACVELVAWNYGRLKDRKIGVIGSGKNNCEHYERAMPENVKMLLEPWKRRVV